MQIKAGYALACAIALGLFAAFPVNALERRCNKARHVAGMEKPIPKLHERIEQGDVIRIVALGSSSTEGTPDMDKRDIYPAVMERMLAREVLNPVEIINKGRGGEQISHMLARLERDVIGMRPDLVVWQLGVNDVLALDGVEAAIADMRLALQRLRVLGIPVVLVDLQVAPMVDRDKDTPTMQAAIAEAAKSEGVLHFHRYDVMHNLLSTAEARMEDLVTGDGLHMTKLGHYCTGALLAKQIAGGALTRLAMRQRAAE